jgi:hypothetical protein
LKHLKQPHEALACYQKADTSKVPHLDWQPNISPGLQDAQSALAQLGAVSLKS